MELGHGLTVRHHPAIEVHYLLARLNHLDHSSGASCSERTSTRRKRNGLDRSACLSHHSPPSRKVRSVAPLSCSRMGRVRKPVVNFTRIPPLVTHRPSIGSMARRCWSKPRRLVHHRGGRSPPNTRFRILVVAVTMWIRRLVLRAMIVPSARDFLKPSGVPSNSGIST